MNSFPCFAGQWPLVSHTPYSEIFDDNPSFVFRRGFNSQTWAVTKLWWLHFSFPTGEPRDVTYSAVFPEGENSKLLTLCEKSVILRLLHTKTFSSVFKLKRNYSLHGSCVFVLKPEMDCLYFKTILRLAQMDCHDTNYSSFNFMPQFIFVQYLFFFYIHAKILIMCFFYFVYSVYLHFPENMFSAYHYSSSCT